MNEFGLPAVTADVLTSDKYIADYFEATLKLFNDARQLRTGSWVKSFVL
jgi:Asp-tRNA(Asn)/Glu-tRNA(Gln) amidotransferase B subunit